MRAFPSKKAHVPVVARIHAFPVRFEAIPPCRFKPDPSKFLRDQARFCIRRRLANRRPTPPAITNKAMELGSGMALNSKPLILGLLNPVIVIAWLVASAVNVPMAN